MVKLEETATGEMVRARERQRGGESACQGNRKRGAENHKKSETERDGRYRERRAKGMSETSLKFPVTPGQCFKLFKALRFIKTGS